MRTVSEKYRQEIETERMWLASQQGELIFYSMLPVSLIVVFSLWDTAAHRLLLPWFLILNGINLLRWLSLRFYHLHKSMLLGDIKRFKRILFMLCLMSGCWSGVGNFWLLEPSQISSLLIMSFFTLGIGIGAIMSWFFYLPCLIAVMLPALGSLDLLLFLQGDKTSLTLGALLFLFAVWGVALSQKLTNMFTYTLELNFDNQALRQESEEKSRLLEAALKEAEQANAAKTRFLAAASHDLRQPMHALGLFFSELSDRVHGPETAPVIDQIEAAIAAVNSMLNALLDVSKLDAGIVKPIPEPTALAEVFARLQTEFQSIALENRNDLTIRPTTRKVLTDLSMLERILRNLVGNALRYTENGRILVAARPRGQEIEIQVMDTGSGIPEDQLEEIFVEFHQLQNPARDRRQGLGLGLAIVKRLARLLDHGIKVTSRLGHGSCFAITLPLAIETVNDIPKSMAENTGFLNGSLTGRQVLVLDDDPAILQGMSNLLTRWGCRVATAASAAKANEKLSEIGQKLDLLIVDYRLPEPMDGIGLAKQLQDSLSYPIAVLVITGDTGPERLREAEASGYQLLHKPVQPAKLRSTLQYLAGKLARTGAD